MIRVLGIIFYLCGTLNAHAETGHCASMFHFDPTRFFWQFPSDHLPAVGIVSLHESAESFPIVTWNVLNSFYMKYITADENMQGLKDSEITQTKDREAKILEILSELTQDTIPALIALQEVDDSLLAKICTWALNHGYELVTAENPDTWGHGHTIDYGVTLFRTGGFSLIKFESTPFLVSGGPSKYILNTRLRSRAGVVFDFVNTHRHAKDVKQFETYLKNSNDVPTIVVGDLNLNEQALDQRLTLISSFARMSKQTGSFTHVDTTRTFYDFDHILFSGAMTVNEDPLLTKKAQKRFKLRKQSDSRTHRTDRRVHL